MNNSINRYEYEIIYKLNKATENWLKKANNRIKTEGIQIIANNKDENITIVTQNANKKYSKEVEAQIQAIKDANTPINEGEKTKYVKVKLIGNNTQSKFNEILSIVKDNASNSTIQNVINNLQ